MFHLAVFRDQLSHGGLSLGHGSTFLRHMSVSPSSCNRASLAVQLGLSVLTTEYLAQAQAHRTVCLQGCSLSLGTWCMNKEKERE